MKKEYDFSKAERGRFYRKGARARLPTVRSVDISFKITPQVAEALNDLRSTGLFGDGGSNASVAEELLRRVLLDPAILPYWKKP